ncbi:mCG147050 [Mus musculus]|nr:mCG147050 [Mus musculus]
MTGRALGRPSAWHCARLSAESSISFSSFLVDAWWPVTVPQAFRTPPQDSTRPAPPPSLCAVCNIHRFFFSSSMLKNLCRAGIWTSPTFFFLSLNCPKMALIKNNNSF